MQPDVSADYEWGRRYMPAIKRIIAEYLIVEAPFEEDAQRATDLIVLRLDTIRVACRIRRADMLDRYPDEFTIRSRRASGTKTELEKVVAGYGDYLFYGFGDDAGDLLAWALCDLSIFRVWFVRATVAAKAIPGALKDNGDGTCFRAFKLADLPEEFIVARKRCDDPSLAAVARPAATVTHLHPGRPVTSQHDEALYARLADEIFPPGSAKP